MIPFSILCLKMWFLFSSCKIYDMHTRAYTHKWKIVSQKAMAMDKFSVNIYETGKSNFI